VKRLHSIASTAWALAVAAAVLICPPAAAAEAGTCAPALEVRGVPDTLVDEVQESLRAHGLQPAVPGCLQAHVHVATDGGAIEVWFVDVQGRETHRRLPASGEVAAWLESMVRRDLLEGVLPVPRPIEPAPAPAPSAPPPVAVLAAAPSRPRGSPLSPLRITLGPTVAVSFAGHPGGGPYLGACWQLSSVCLGALVRVLVGPNDPPLSVHALATAQWWITSHIAPYGGLGVRRDLLLGGPATDPVNGTANDALLRLEIGVMGALRLGARFSLEGQIFVAYHPTADALRQVGVGQRMAELDRTGDAGASLLLRWQ
jgi:hypothetical protein